MNKDQIPKAGSPGEAELALQMRLYKVAHAIREYRFSDRRKWRFDFAWPELLLAVEVEGITHDAGRHQRKDGFEKDLEKYEAAMLDGWTVYRCSTAMVKSGRAVDTIKILIGRIQDERDNRANAARAAG